MIGDLSITYSSYRELLAEHEARKGPENLMPRNPFKEISQSLSILGRKDQRKYKQVLGAQACLGLLDLFGVALLGVIGSLAIRGVQSSPVGDKVARILDWFHLSEISLQKQVALLALIAVTVLVGKTLVNIFLTRKILFFLSNKTSEISAELTSKVFMYPELGVKANSSHEIQYAIGSGVTAIAIGVLGAASTLIADFALLVILTVGLIIYDPLTALTVTAIFSIVGCILYILMFKRARRISSKIVDYNITSNKTLLEAIQTYREIYVGDKRGHYINRISSLKSGIARSVAEQTFLPSISKYVMEVALILGSMALSAVLFITQDASHAAAGLALFIASGSRIGPALLRIQQSLIQVQSSYIESLPALKLINEIRLQPTRILKSNNPEANSFVPHIQIQSVYFRYSGSDKYVISDFSLEISPGMTVAIVGPSGGGKSTFIDLVLGIHKPETGVVLISEEIPEQAIVNWPGKIAYVPQDVRVIDASILENIALGHSPEVVDFKRIGEVIKLAQLEDFVASLPFGLNENVGEFGGRLSGGQRQRIGIARALYSNPEILVLDEATSSLDGQTEADVSEALKSLKGKMSLLIVAHRLATVREADLVVYINQGKIEAMGSFNEVRARVPDFDNQANLMGL